MDESKPLALGQVKAALQSVMLGTQSGRKAGLDTQGLDAASPHPLTDCLDVAALPLWTRICCPPRHPPPVKPSSLGSDGFL